MAGPNARGYVFFHQECTDRAANGGGLMLYYGGFDGSGQDAAAVGRQTVAALEHRGLKVEWDGDPDRAITVDVDWRRRLAE